MSDWLFWTTLHLLNRVDQSVVVCPSPSRYTAMKFVPCLVVFSCVFAYAYALTCYDCSSLTRGDACETSIPTNSTPTEECTDVGASCSTTSVSGVYTRTCEASCEEQDLCVGISILRVCTKKTCCSTDRCNADFDSASSVVVSFFVVVVGLVLSVVIVQ